MRTPIPCGPALVLAPALLALPASVLQAAGSINVNPNVPETTPTSDFVLDDANGTAYHEETGLTWQRCAMGKTWSNGTCAGGETLLTWQQALRAAALAGSGSRLPNIKELASIVELRNWSPAINEEVFPNPPITRTWSS